MRRLRARKNSLAHFENSAELCFCFCLENRGADFNHLRPVFSFLLPLAFYVVAAGMATREAMEASKATSQTLESPLYHAPTLRPGLGAPRCPRCSAPLSKDLQASGWTIAPFMRESFAMVGTAAGGSLSSLYAFNAVMPLVKKRIGGPIWFQFVVGLPPIMLFSVGCAGLAGGALPGFAQLAVSTYHAATASSHSTISKVIMQVEERGSNPLPPVGESPSTVSSTKGSLSQKS